MRRHLERYAASGAKDTRFGATTAPRAYDRGMTDQQRDTTGQDAASALTPLRGTLDLIGGDAAGSCSGGFCRFPTPGATPHESAPSGTTPPEATSTD